LVSLETMAAPVAGGTAAGLENAMATAGKSTRGSVRCQTWRQGYRVMVALRRASSIMRGRRFSLSSFIRGT
jgi:hypothetical protein